MQASKEFVVGKHGIGFVSPDFRSKFGGTEFERAKSTPAFQTLSTDMNDAAIERDLKPGYCTLGDVLAFIEAAPAQAKDGYANLFYTPSCVVGVFWSGDGWRVYAWERVGYAWYAGSRVFSPAADQSSTLNTGPSGALTLDALAERVSLLEQALVSVVAKTKPKKRSKIKKANRKR